MLLSEELIQIGKESNPKSNMSMAQSADKMLKLLQQKQESLNTKQLVNIVKTVCKSLNAEGWNYFKLETFFKAIA